VSGDVCDGTNEVAIGQFSHPNGITSRYSKKDREDLLLKAVFEASGSGPTGPDVLPLIIELCGLEKAL
jgi:hypothetical protein